MAALGPEAARIFRITHVNNVPWLLQHGLHCQSSKMKDQNFVPIGMAELIGKRQTREIDKGPGGVLSDYVPFYFTPWSVMLLNIKTGYNGVIKRQNSEIAILVSSLHRLQELDVPFVFTNGHAYMRETDYFEDLTDLSEVDWELLRRRDFKKDAEDPGKVGRYQAEALVHRHVPVAALLGIGCYDQRAQDTLEAAARKLGVGIKIQCTPDWYFR